MTEGAFVGLWDIIEKCLAWFFPASLMATPTWSILYTAFQFIAGFYMLYFLLFKPIIIFFRSLKSWRVTK